MPYRVRGKPANLGRNLPSVSTTRAYDEYEPVHSQKRKQKVKDQSTSHPTSRESPASDVAVVRHFLDAWADCDAAGVQKLVAEDAVFCLSTGPEPGLTLSGSQEIGPVIDKMLSEARGTVLSVTDLITFDGGVVGTWTVTGINSKGQAVNVKGIGILWVSGAKITRLDGYRKVAA